MSRRTLRGERDRARATAVTLENTLAERERDMAIAVDVLRAQICTCHWVSVANPATGEGDGEIDMCVRCVCLAWLEPRDVAAADLFDGEPMF